VGRNVVGDYVVGVDAVKKVGRLDGMEIVAAVCIVEGKEDVSCEGTDGGICDGGNVLDSVDDTVVVM
jgi:hypothetical protein